MCAACAMAAVGAVSGTRAWLNVHGFAWLTPRRLRAVTIGLSAVALLGSTLTVSGSTAAHAHRAPPAASVTR